VLKRLALILTALASMALAVSQSQAQSALLNLPRPSQRAEVIQRVGITDITISYHRPLVNKREIWGKLVPYGQTWRAGANENTTIQFTDDVTIEGEPLAKGVYGLHMLPRQDEWTVIFSKVSTAWGSFTYNEANDALRVTVKPQPSEMHEALTYDFDDIKADSAVVSLRWEKLAVAFKVGVNVNEVVKASLPNQLQGLSQYMWEGWDDAATYLLGSKYDLNDALKYEETSIRTEPRFDNFMTKSQILDAMGKKDEAKAALNQALERATAAQLYGYGRQLQGQGKQDEAFKYFQEAARKDPSDWLAHDGTARIYSAKGDFANALKEMKLSYDGAPGQSEDFPRAKHQETGGPTGHQQELKSPSRPLVARLGGRCFLVTRNLFGIFIHAASSFAAEAARFDVLHQQRRRPIFFAETLVEILQNAEPRIQTH
jgi:tetratricopeptide (TPR) repeat protein